AQADTFADATMESHRGDKPTGTKARARFVFPELGTIDPALPKAKRLEQLARLVTHPDNGRFTRTIANRIWQRMMGRGIVHPVDVIANRQRDDDLLAHRGVYLADNHDDLKQLPDHIPAS